jgi:hypothetical protein
MGAKLAAPEKQVINIMGDAAVGMAGMDFETASRSRIPILTVILNNGVMTHYNEHMPYLCHRDVGQQQTGWPLCQGGGRAWGVCRAGANARLDRPRHPSGTRCQSERPERRPGDAHQGGGSRAKILAWLLKARFLTALP